MNDVALRITPKSNEIFECEWHAKLHNSENFHSVREFSIHNVLSLLNMAYRDRTIREKLKHNISQIEMAWKRQPSNRYQNEMN